MKIAEGDAQYATTTGHASRPSIHACRRPSVAYTPVLRLQRGLIQFNYQMRGGLECREGGLKKSRSTSCFHVCCRRLYISPHLIRAPITCFPPVKFKHEWVVRMHAPREEKRDWYCAALFAETVLFLNKSSIFFFLETHRPNLKLSCKSYCS